MEEKEEERERTKEKLQYHFVPSHKKTRKINNYLITKQES